MGAILRFWKDAIASAKIADQQDRLISGLSHGMYIFKKTKAKTAMSEGITIWHTFDCFAFENGCRGTWIKIHIWGEACQKNGVPVWGDVPLGRPVAVDGVGGGCTPKLDSWGGIPPIALHDIWVPSMRVVRGSTYESTFKRLKDIQFVTWFSITLSGYIGPRNNVKSVALVRWRPASETGDHRWVDKKWKQDLSRVQSKVFGNLTTIIDNHKRTSNSPCHKKSLIRHVKTTKNVKLTTALVSRR